MLNNMTIKARLILLVSVIMVIGIIVASAAYSGMSTLQSATDDIAGRRIHLIRNVNKLMFAMADNRAHLMRAMQHDPSNPSAKLHDHPISKHLDAIAATKSQIDEMFVEQHQGTHSAEGNKLLKEFEDARNAYVIEGLMPGVQATKAGDFSGAQVLLATKINPLLDAVIVKGHALAEHENEGAKQEYEDAMADSNTSKSVLIAGMLFMSVVAIVLGYNIISSVVRSTGGMRDAMMRMASDGDLSARAVVIGKDEVAEAATAFNSLIAGFGNIIRQVNTNAEHVSVSAGNLSSSSMRISQGSQAQSSAAASTAAAIEEMTVSISSVAANTDDVRKLSERSLEKTKQGNQSVDVMINEIKNVQEAVTQIAGSVKEFVDSTRAIAGMTQQVKDIADQTNLLALNAAIEAARAGEQGRGFAVVADEVRKLAEKSAQSANEIDSVTNSLNQKSNHVEATVQSGLRSLQTTHEQVERVSELLAEGGDAVARSSHGVNDIAVAVGEQSLASNEIARNVERIAQMSEENYSAVSMNTQEIAHLEELAKELQVAVSRFRV